MQELSIPTVKLSSGNGLHAGIWGGIGRNRAESGRNRGRNRVGLWQLPTPNPPHSGPEKNGFASAGKRTEHFEVRFHFTTDLIARNTLSVEHCDTLDMTADALTKPLSGNSHQRHRDTIMGIEGKNIASCDVAARECLKTKGLL